jgi:hypothetical protein
MNNFIFIDYFLSIYTCTRVHWRRQEVRERVKALCRCMYTDGRKLPLKGSYLYNWTFHNVVTDVTTFLNTLP